MNRQDIQFYVDFNPPNNMPTPQEYKKSLRERWNAAKVGYDYEDIRYGLCYAQQKGIVKNYDFERLKQMAAQKAQNNANGINKSMVAAMYDIVTDKWFIGYSGHKVKNQDNHILESIKSLIPQHENREHYQFGWGCAEVHCLKLAYEERYNTGRKEGQDYIGIKDCVFAAYSPIDWNSKTNKKGRPRPPCNGCLSWLKKCGTRWNAPKL
ncbi:MAG: hypothetical protein RIG63_20515 [Coleofasciculus chthonoplastes F3-SA18-01]|uniref:hypothetical protein n=1 Tax=Coleofasciculus chthonoplastes TaxID=64178 RepID=UPI0033045143